MSYLLAWNTVWLVVMSNDKVNVGGKTGFRGKIVKFTLGYVYGDEGRTWALDLGVVDSGR